MVIAGIDEVGRGCLAGPVIAAVVVLDPERTIEGLADSKLLTAKQRVRLAEEIRSTALDWAIGRCEVSEIDRINILQASLLAMKRAFLSLEVVPDLVKVDGIHYPPIDVPGETIIKGDRSVAAISAASILAKTARDNEMVVLDVIAPGYGFSAHKGYPTKQHTAALKKLGATPWHRKSFAPVRLLNSD